MVAVALARVPVPVAKVAVIVPVAVVTTLPLASSTLTTGWVENATPLVAVDDGWVVITSWVAVPTAEAGETETNVKPVASNAVAAPRLTAERSTELSPNEWCTNQ